LSNYCQESVTLWTLSDYHVPSTAHSTIKKKIYSDEVQKDPAKLLNIKNLHAMAKHRNDWTKNLEKPISQSATGRRKSFLMHVLTKLNF
jgi:hypothetical protein